MAVDQEMIAHRLQNAIRHSVELRQRGTLATVRSNGMRSFLTERRIARDEDTWRRSARASDPLPPGAVDAHVAACANPKCTICQLIRLSDEVRRLVFHSTEGD